MLRLIASQLDVIGPPIHHTNAGVATLSTRIQNQVRATGSDHTDLHEVDLEVPGRQPISGDCQEPFEKAVKGHLKPRYQQNSEAESRVRSSLATIKCTCANLTNDSGYHRTDQVYRFLGGLIFSKQGDMRGSHRPGCILFRNSPRKPSKTTLTYLGFRYMLSRILTVSLMQNYPTGAYSLSFELQPCDVVKSSPALALFDHPTGQNMLSKNFKKLGWQETTKRLIEEITTMYKSGHASPFDVDIHGNNIAHKCVQVSNT